MKFFIAILILLASLALQASVLPFDLIFAALIAFAFAYEWHELLPLLALGILGLSWEPGMSMVMLAYAACPLAAYGAHRVFKWEPWMGVAVASLLSAALLGWAAGFITSLFAVQDAVAMMAWGLVTYGFITRIDR